MNLDSSIIVIFGATGDLTQRKLLPSLFGLYANNLLPEKFKIIAIGRNPIDNEDFVAKCAQSIDAVKNNFLTDKGLKYHADELLASFVENIEYKKVNALFPEDYPELKEYLDSQAQSLDIPRNYIFYLSTPPSAYTTIAEHLYQAGLAKQEDGWKRLIVEKPFGYDLTSAKQLNSDLHKFFKEQQLYRIDHYLGKETVQNLLVFRFANTIFEPIWNRDHIDYVEITAAESLGVEARAAYYDHSGALRDMLQNHLLNVFSFVAMEAPARIDADSIRDEQVKVIRALKPLSQQTLDKQILLAQYTQDPTDHSRVGYLQENGVNPESNTETYIQAKLEIDNWRWSGVPFYIRTGKRLNQRLAEIIIHFKKSPLKEFKERAPANCLVFRIQPDESISMLFGMKKPGQGFNFEQTLMDFLYSDLDDGEQKLLILDAYQRLLLDCIRGDATLFTRADFVNECWKYVQPIIDLKESGAPVTMQNYESGS